MYVYVYVYICIYIYIIVYYWCPMNRIWRTSSQFKSLGTLGD